ncbi:MULTISPECIES: hypothetical protein [unclassified Neochlamydia]|uniref:hypothetical protein n=1 Tax=unclassified Neochlamydia TaxID=2643326 RepID=UPI00140A66B2|nr:MULTISPECIES: hypothetical protein [unclassified Neochlamydia]MBS4171034.1 Uncharacterized protein [Neochlamydia sp. AcF95]NGY94673.1 hypothetical protein [Neochlamydia sp. AcF84]
MTARSHRVKVTIDVSEDERIYIKMLAAKERMTISDFIMSFVRPNIPYGQPNAETRKALCDVDKRKNLTHCKNLEEFWAAMGIDPRA